MTAKTERLYLILLTAILLTTLTVFAISYLSIAAEKSDYLTLIHAYGLGTSAEEQTAIDRTEWLLNYAGLNVYEDGSFDMTEGYRVRSDGAVIIAGCLPGGECAK